MRWRERRDALRKGRAGQREDEAGGKEKGYSVTRERRRKRGEERRKGGMKEESVNKRRRRPGGRDSGEDEDAEEDKAAFVSTTFRFRPQTGQMTAAPGQGGATFKLPNHRCNRLLIPRPALSSGSGSSRGTTRLPR
ncbi:hypothetical protein EYF80_019207 [Liparis tanakae]|uniref:Uncharacterized protein n=1 Tax=Liparis tanakae TaxID=230148 RepID=A0A4Z2I066_9TELE|nr:hypothetical protein EYF80_019207 [Liparis tanakae]